MVTELHHEEVLDIIGLDKTRKDMIVLGALLKAQKSQGDFIEFATLRKQLDIDEGSRKGKDSLIYRSLSWLEKGGFLKIDKGGHKHGYSSNIVGIEKALGKILSKKLKTLDKELKQVDSEVAAFSDMNSDLMASGVIELAAGKKKIEKPVFAQSWEAILKLLDDKIYHGLKKGDVVRIKLEWLTQINYLDPKRALNIEKLLEKGVEVRALDHDRGEKNLRESMKQLLAKMRGISENIGYRILPRKDATYQFIGRNAEGIVLVVSESPLSATWLPRGSNADLVDNAIESFDTDYDLGTDMLDFEG